MAAGDAGSRLVPVILAGGTGSRLWPVSTPAYPKQFLPLAGDTSLFVRSLRRAQGTFGFAPAVIVGSIEHEALIARDCAAAGITPKALILEPVARNTAMAIAFAALAAAPADCLLIMPSDHLIAEPSRFHAAVLDHRHLLSGDLIATFGILPGRPETGYGYIRSGAPIAGTAASLVSFQEKPDIETARRLIAEGWLWNSGIFMATASLLVELLDRFAPQVIAAARSAMAAAERRETVILPAPGPLRHAPSMSFDRAVMERRPAALVIALDAGWSDVGSWDEVWRLAPKDASGNSVTGNVVLRDARNSYVSSDGPPTVLCGLDGVVVINSGGRLLITTLSRAQDVKQLADDLAAPLP